MQIQFYNTLSRGLEDFVPLVPGEVRIYSCGPTVYSSPHIGNFRSFLLSDLLRRFLEDRAFKVTQVMNITDVGHLTEDDVEQGEDKMQAAARREQLDPWAIAQKYTDEFVACMEQLGMKQPHEMPRATDHIQEMGAIIADLLQRGIAYQVAGNVYFDISRFPEYGRLSGKRLDQLEEGARVAVNTEKRDPRDFALWKVDSKHLMQWDAPFPGGQRGFPGWHIECSAMSMKYLGPSFDIHTGGEDNVFPHHECEIAQSQCHTGEPFVRYWLHARHLLVDGKKMSKSLGNFFTVQDILDRGYSGIELRYALLRVHYRASMNFTLAAMDDGRAALERIRTCRERLVRIRDGAEHEGVDALSGELDAREHAFVDALADDLNTPKALEQVFGFVSACNRSHPPREDAGAALRLFQRWDDVLGVFGPEPTGDGSGAPPEVVDMAERRQQARAQKDWATADALRDGLSAKGFQVIDDPNAAKGYRIEAL